MTPIAVTVMGSCNVTIAGRVVPGVPSNFFRIAAYLILSGQHLSAPRHRLGAVLWPNIDHVMAGANLRQALLRIRHFQAEHGFTLISANFSTVFMEQLTPVDVDLLSIVGLLHDTAPTGAVDLCKLLAGELLYDIGDSGPDFEEWLALQRSHLRDRCADRLAMAIVASGYLSSTERIACAHKLLDIDPCDENAYRQLMLEASENGQISRIHILFDACKRQLIQEFGVQPSLQTLELFKQLTHD